MVLLTALALGVFWPWSESHQSKWADAILYPLLGILCALFLAMPLAHVRKLKFSLTLMLLLMVLVSELLAVWSLNPPGRSKKAKWWTVEMGMTEREVEMIMGSRGIAKPTGGGEVDWFYDGDITISFRNGRVSEALHFQLDRPRRSGYCGYGRLTTAKSQ
jgi:hypothetical protein